MTSLHEYLLRYDEMSTGHVLHIAPTEIRLSSKSDRITLGSGKRGTDKSKRFYQSTNDNRQQSNSKRCTKMNDQESKLNLKSPVFPTPTLKWKYINAKNVRRKLEGKTVGIQKGRGKGRNEGKSK